MVSESGELMPSESSVFTPEHGGIHPREAADHHSTVASDLVSRVMSREGFSQSDVKAVSFSQGPGLGPCLRVGASLARTLSKSWQVPLIGVNHCVAHIEVGRNQTGCEDPVLLYASGGNTQVIARAGSRYRVLGETLDIGIGNMLDKFARTHEIPFPGGPVIEKKAAEWANGSVTAVNLELPYAVHGMDLAFSGILTAAISLSEREGLGAASWSLQDPFLFLNLFYPLELFFLPLIPLTYLQPVVFFWLLVLPFDLLAWHEMQILQYHLQFQPHQLLLLQ